MEEFTSGKFGYDNKMFASWFSGSLYIMEPFDVLTSDYESYENFKVAQMECV